MTENYKELYSILQDDVLHALDRAVPIPPILLFYRDCRYLVLLCREKKVPHEVMLMIRKHLKSLYPCFQEMMDCMPDIVQCLKEAASFGDMQATIYISGEDTADTRRCTFPFIAEWLQYITLHHYDYVMTERSYFRFLNRRLTTAVYTFLRDVLGDRFTLIRKEEMYKADPVTEYSCMRWSIVVSWAMDDTNERVFKRVRLKE